jgi:hypothetical protein
LAVNKIGLTGNNYKRERLTYRQKHRFLLTVNCNIRHVSFRYSARATFMKSFSADRNNNFLSMKMNAIEYCLLGGKIAPFMSHATATSTSKAEIICAVILPAMGDISI